MSTTWTQTYLDFGLAMPGAGCLVPRFEGTLIFETLSFMGVGSLFILAWAFAKAMGHQDPQAAEKGRPALRLPRCRPRLPRGWQRC